MHTYYHQYQVKHNNVQKDPQTKHNPPKYHHPSVEYWLTPAAHFVRIHRNIKNSERSERQASACPPFRGGGSFCSLIFSHNATSYSHHTSHIQQLKKPLTIPIIPQKSPTIHTLPHYPNLSLQHSHQITTSSSQNPHPIFPTRSPLNLH